MTVGPIPFRLRRDGAKLLRFAVPSRAASLFAKQGHMRYTIDAVSRDSAGHRRIGSRSADLRIQA